MVPLCPHYYLTVDGFPFTLIQVLGTDMKQHFGIMTQFNSKVEAAAAAAAQAAAQAKAEALALLAMATADDSARLKPSSSAEALLLLADTATGSRDFPEARQRLSLSGLRSSGAESVRPPPSAGAFQSAANQLPHNLPPLSRAPSLPVDAAIQAATKFGQPRDPSGQQLPTMAAVTLASVPIDDELYTLSWKVRGH